MGGYLATLRVRLTAEIGDLQRRMREAEGSMRAFAKVASVLAVVTVGLTALGLAWDATTSKAREFNTAMAEVATVADPASVDALTASVQKLSLQFGGTAAAQAQGLYEIISAGTSNAAAATEALAQSNKLAIGGITSVKIAADGLTSAMNAYGAASGGAQAVSDSFFVAAAQGKTTISELSSNIGRVAPLAASMKIPLDEVTAALAALTKGGIATGPATAGLAQILSSVVKPSEQAAETAKKLGLEFNAAALQSKGLAGFLADVAEKTKGNTTAMGLLFGGVEALVPALALSTTGAADFANALDAMENKAGATDRAYAIMADSMENRIARLQAKISGAAVQIGTSLLNVAIPAAEAFADNFVPIMETAAQVAIVLAAVMIGRMVPAFLAATRAVIAHGVALLATATRAGIAAVAMNGLRGALAFFGGPIGLAVTAVMALIGLAFLDAGRKARKAAADAAAAAEAFKASLGVMNDATLNASANNARTNIRMFDDAVRRQQAVIDRINAALPNLAGRDRAVALDERSAAEYRLKELRAGHERYMGELRQHKDEIDRRAAANVTLPPTPSLGDLDLGVLDDAAEQGKSAIGMLVERGNALVAVLEAQKESGQDTTAVLAALHGMAGRAQSALAGLGDPAGLNAEGLGNYRDLLNLVQQIHELRGEVAVAVDTEEARKQLAALDQQVRTVVKAADRLKVIAPGLTAGDFSKYIGRGTDALAAKLGRVADDIRDALKEGAEAAYQSLAAAATVIRQQGTVGGITLSAVANAASGPMREFAATFAAVREARRTQKDETGNAGGLPPAVAAGGMVVAMELIGGMMEVLAPALQALLLPVTLLGSAIGKALLPVVRAMWPVFKAVTIAATYIGQIFFTVAGAIASAIGWLVRGIGKLLNELPGSIGAPLVRAGDALLAVGSGFFAGAKELAKAREEIAGLSFEDALKRVSNAANETAQALYGVPQAYRLLAHRQHQTQAAVTLPGTTPRAMGGTAQQTVYSGTVHVETHIHAAPGGETEASLYAKWRAEVQRKARGAADPQFRAFALAIPA